MVTVARTDPSILGRWWWTVDRWSLAALALLLGFGAILSFAASPPTAARIGISEYHFVQRHLAVIAPTVAVLLLTSLLDPVWLRRIALVVLGLAMVGMVLTLTSGMEIKGATRWLHLPGLTIQPSEFAKPAFAVVAAWLFAQRRLHDGFPGYAAGTLVFAVLLGLLAGQPDLGMAVVVTAMWGVQIFLAGLPVVLVAGLAALALGGMVASYYLLDHVASRIDRFLDPTSGDSYQIDRAMEAFGNGGLWGVGPGEGTIKHSLPDAHADFVFAVAGEEFGLLWCLVLVALFSVVVLRGFARAFAEPNLFALIAAAGLLTQFALQALTNMGSTLHLIPTKGMTLPFLSYGGSSMIAVAYGMGMVLALTRRRPGLRALP